MDNMEPEILEEDLIIADEFTMSDMKLASMLFSRIKTGARLILVGDADQLPSVGPGDVFRELIVSDVIPVTVLDEFSGRRRVKYHMECGFDKQKSKRIFFMEMIYLYLCGRRI